MQPASRKVRDNRARAAMRTVMLHAGLAVLCASFMCAVGAADCISAPLPGRADAPRSFMTVHRAAPSNTAVGRTRIRCILPESRGMKLALLRGGVRYSGPFSSPERFGNMAIAPYSYKEPPKAAPRPALMRPVDEREPFVPARIPDMRVSMRDEMVAARDFDNGRIRAMAVRDGTDPLRIGGFVRIPTVWGMRFAPPEIFRSVPIMLAEAVNRFTGIDARMDGHLMLTDRRLFSTPFLYITTEKGFELTRQERERFGDYLRSGGFAFLEDSAPQYEHGPGGTALKQMLRDTIGCHARLEPIPMDHPLYRCLFDFSDGPPQGDGNMTLNTRTIGDCGGSAISIRFLAPVYFLEGIFLDGRLVAVYSEKGYGRKWALNNNYGFAYNSPQMRFAANLVVYALTREGGMTDRIMEGFTDVW